MKQRDYSKWERIRAKGKTNYVIRYGVFGWGFSTAVLFYLFTLATGNINSYFRDGIFILVIFLIGGYGWGRTMWKWMERSYQKTLK